MKGRTPPGLDIEPRIAATLPAWEDTMTHLRAPGKPRAAEVLERASRDGRVVVQPRCGVGGHDEMRLLLRSLDLSARPGILSLTIDSYTRLRKFGSAARTLERNPGDLNGYPLVTHGWRRGRDLDAAVRAPIEVRHGSPDPRELFAVAIASGLTSFEGGGISYNLPYSKDVPLHSSLAAWQQVDLVCGELARNGVIVDREFFGSLTAVLVPPSVSLAVSFLEARLAGLAGVRCLSIAYPQGGEIHQDIAALRGIPELAARYLPGPVTVYPTLHQFMGVFPAELDAADALIFLGGLTARLGGATRVISKTRQEAHGIPDADANVAGIRTTVMACSELFDFIRLDEARIEEELHWLLREVDELVAPILNDGGGPASIVHAFDSGRLDVPFSSSVHARAEVIPKRDASGAIRYLYTGSLPFSRATLRRNEQHLRVDRDAIGAHLVKEITADVNYFLRIHPPGRRTGRR